MTDEHEERRQRDLTLAALRSAQQFDEVAREFLGYARAHERKARRWLWYLRIAAVINVAFGLWNMGRAILG